MCASLGALLALALTPVQSAVWYQAEAPPVVRALAPLHDVATRLAHALSPGADLYHFYGRAFVLVHLGALAGLALLWRHTTRGRGPRPTWLAVLAVALAAAAVLDVAAYSGTSSNVPFGLEMAAVIVALAAAALHGRQVLVTRALPRWTGWALVATAPAAVLCVVLTQYLPHGAVLPLGLAIAATAVGATTRGRPVLPG